MRPEAQLQQALKDIAQFEPHLAGVLASLREWMGSGYPTGGGGNRPNGISKPTERIGMASAELGDRDAFGRDHAQITEDLATIMLAARRIAKAVDRSRPLPTDPMTGATVIAPAQGCLPCAQVKDPKTGRPHERGYQDVYVRRPRPGGDGREIPYCSWHADFIDKYGMEPNQALTLYHLEHHGYITRRLVKELHPEAAANLGEAPLAVSKLGLG